MSFEILPPSQESVVEVKDLSKCYRIYDHPRDRLLQAFVGHRRQYFREFWALKEINFRLARGQTVGIVGRNGSGKSTLLQLICGTLTPTAGRVAVRGRVGALLELGSGFNPDFTGRENIFLNAAVLGLTQADIERRLDDILAFADIGPFIDQPVKSYSSGMALRLAFSVQAHIDAEVLVVDEALAVGDELFQKKCYDHLERLKAKGSSILLVTHSCPAIIQHCDEAILLHRGRLRLWGRPDRVTVTYQRLSNASDQEWDQAMDMLASPSASQEQNSTDLLGRRESDEMPTEHSLLSHESPSPSFSRFWHDPTLLPQSTIVYPEKGACINDVVIETEEGVAANVLLAGLPFVLRWEYSAKAGLGDLAFGCHIASHSGQRITGQVYPIVDYPRVRIDAGGSCTIRFHFSGSLWPGLYFIGGGIWNEGDETQFIHRVVDYRALRIVQSEQAVSIGACNLQLAPPEFMLGSPLTQAGPQG